MRARELPFTGRDFLLGLVLPFVGGGVTEFDQCFMLFMYAIRRQFVEHQKVKVQKETHLL